MKAYAILLLKGERNCQTSLVEQSIGLRIKSEIHEH